MPIILGGGDSSSSYEIDNSLRFNGANQYMSRTPGSA